MSDAFFELFGHYEDCVWVAVGEYQQADLLENLVVKGAAVSYCVYNR